MNSKLYPSLETDRLYIRPTHADDAQFIFHLLNTPKWKQYIGDRHVQSIEEARNYIISRMYPQLDTYGYSNNTIQRKSDLQLIGIVGIYHRDNLDIPDLGFGFLPEYEGHGYAYESAVRLIDEAKDEYGIHELSAITALDNMRSKKLLEKLGFHFVENKLFPGDNEELSYFIRKL